MIFVEEGIVKVRFRADGVEGASIPCADLFDKVGAEICARFEGLRVVEVDLAEVISTFTYGSVLDSATNLNKYPQIRPNLR